MVEQLSIDGSASPYKHYITAMICPLCKRQINQSEFLASVIEDKKVLYLANLITHYRHDHISWDRQWSYMQRKHPMWDYEECKSQVNERAKRQYIRKAYPLFRSMGITAGHFAQLMNTDDKTLGVANKFL